MEQVLIVDNNDFSRQQVLGKSYHNLNLLKISDSSYDSSPVKVFLFLSHQLPWGDTTTASYHVTRHA